MDSIMALLDGFDLAKLLPDLQKVFSDLHTWVGLALLIGPIILLVIGLTCLFMPPKEANHRFGFRTLFGMGSVRAWRFTQKIAGLVWSGLGLILLIWMLIHNGVMGSAEIIDYMTASLKVMIAQAVLIFLAWLALNIVPMVLFDWNGNSRRGDREPMPAPKDRRQPKKTREPQKQPEPQEAIQPEEPVEFDDFVDLEEFGDYEEPQQ